MKKYIVLAVSLMVVAGFGLHFSGVHAVGSPTISSISPTSVPIDGSYAATMVVIYGSNFDQDSYIVLDNNGMKITPESQSATGLAFHVSQSMSVGQHTVQVGENNSSLPLSNSVTLTTTVTQQPPVITSVSPTSTYNGGNIGADSVTLYGSNFDAWSHVIMDGTVDLGNNAYNTNYIVFGVGSSTTPGVHTIKVAERFVTTPLISNSISLTVLDSETRPLIISNVDVYDATPGGTVYVYGNVYSDSYILFDGVTKITPDTSTISYGDVKFTIPSGTTAGVHTIQLGKLIGRRALSTPHSITVLPPRPAAATLTITSPVKNDIWVGEAVRTITWDTTGIPSDAIGRIILRGPDAKNYWLTPGATISNTGSYEWDGHTVYALSGAPTPAGTAADNLTWVKTNIPATQNSSFTLSVLFSSISSGTKAGSVYPLVITGTPNYGSGNDLNTSSSSKPTITIISPVANSTWASGSTQTIRWQAPPLAHINQINTSGVIFIRDGNGKTYKVAPIQSRLAPRDNYLPNSGSFVWDSVGTVFIPNRAEINGHDPNTDPVVTDCFHPAWMADPSVKACYQLPTILPPGQYRMSIRFNDPDAELWTTLNNSDPFAGALVSPETTFTIGSSGSVSTPPTKETSTSTSLSVECLGGPGATNHCPSGTSALSHDGQSLLDQIAALQAQLTALQIQTGMQPASTTPPPAYTPPPARPPSDTPNLNMQETPTSTGVTLTRNLKYGMRNDETRDVTALQAHLKANGYLNANPTGFFGRLTLSAVKQFQSANGIPSTGYVGPLTQSALRVIQKKWLPAN